jgi:hypothetical protein
LLREGLVVLYLPVFLGFGEGAAVPIAAVSFMIDVVPFAVRSDRRSLHDLIAGTIVLDDYAATGSPTVRSD